MSKTFRVTHAIALEALQAVGSDPEKLADYLKDKVIIIYDMAGTKRRDIFQDRSVGMRVSCALLIMKVP